MLPDPIFLNVHMYGVTITVVRLWVRFPPSQFWSVIMVIAGILVYFVMRNIYRKAASDETVS